MPSLGIYESDSGEAFTRATLIVPMNSPGADAYEGSLALLLESYTGTDDASVIRGSYHEVRKDRWTADISWAQKIDFDVVAPAYRYNGERYLRPRLEAGVAPPSPFMTWWAVLYAFSILSRYYPREWADVLDVDKSEDAAVIEYFLELALDVIPHLVMEALDGQPVLFAKTLAI